MTSVAPSHPIPMRRSQRRKNKFLNREETQYSIPNPYRASYSHQCLPDILGKQLSKLDYLSTRSLKNLNFPSAVSHEQMDQVLSKMRNAAKKQQEQFEAIIKKHYEEEKRKSEEQNKIDEEQNCQNNAENQVKQSYDSMDIEYSRQMVHSDNVSIFGDNYEADHRLVFYSDHSMGHACMKDDFDLI